MPNLKIPELVGGKERSYVARSYCKLLPVLFPINNCYYTSIKFNSNSQFVMIFECKLMFTI